VNAPAGVSIDSLCRPSSSPQAISAGCTGSDGAALTDSSTACGMCSGEFFLFMGGCYKAGEAPGSEICTAAEGGRCTECNAANGLFQNPATSPTLGSECILCWDTTGADKYTGVENCQTCTAPNSAPGTATCNTCKAGFSGASCTTPCGGSCASCDKSNENTCTSCSGSKYLKDSQCVEGVSNGCGNGKYADPQSNKCISCSDPDSGIIDCDTCAYNAALQGPKCLTCTSPKIVKEETNGATTCILADACTQYANDGPNFLTESSKACILCNNNTDTSTTGNTGVPGCQTCAKSGAGNNPVCKSCLDGYYDSGTGAVTCTACTGENCATCAKDTKDQCSTCKSGYFLQGGTSPGTCTPCDDADSGIPGCATCTLSTSLTCISCKPNYKASGTKSNSVTCTKVCEDPTACGGTAGSCKAAVLDDTGAFHYYCSQCADNSQYPIDGICTNSNAGNTCTNGACQSCAANYFLYMGGCYNVDTEPGSLMCSKASTGICTTPTGQYFVVPGATDKQQSVLGCGNPLGTTTGTGDTAKAYVGVEGCKTCTAPSAPSPAGMAAAKCTACDGSKKPTGSGYGCVTCDTSNCKSCVADGVCGECTDSHYLKTEGSTTSCVRKEACTGGYFPKDESTSGNKCASCSSASDGGITDCSECSLLPSTSRSSTPLVTCTKCSSGNLSPLKNECMTTCPAGTYETGSINKVCTPCHTSCAGCKDDNTESSCTACYPGFVLNQGSTAGKGTCIPECTGRYAENCADGQCTAVLRGSKYCSKCAVGYAPIDGMCTAVATTSRDASVCTASGGVCTTCTGDYALLSGGCYNTQALPGSAVCTAVTGNNGQCSQCANGQTYASGNCPACAEGCAKCATDTNQCDTCYSGYYKSGTKCVKCDTDDSNIKGVPDCVSCKEPSGGPGPVTCYVTQTPIVDPTDPSVNKGGLSSGAIAGISVAVIVVVGGLVGFLCWWFICRGKA
ncbi:Variant-specific surface protein, partial [Giardia duodenalis]